MYNQIIGVNEEVRKNGKQLIEELKSDTFPIDRVPNSAEKFNGYLEHADYLRYKSRITGRLFSFIVEQK